MKYFHGGVPGLLPGANVVPADRLASMPPAYGAGYACDPSRVYITTDVEFARSYAAQYPPERPGMPWRGGDVYEVEPHGPLTVDPDYPAAGLSYSVAGAQVVRLVARRVRLGLREIARIQGPHALWSDGTPVYDVDGFLLPAPQWAARGWTAKHLRGLGQWVNLPIAERALKAAHGDVRRLATAAEIEAEIEAIDTAIWEGGSR